MASTNGDPDDSDADQLLAEALVQYNSEIDYIVQTTGLPMSPDSAISKSTTEGVGEVDTSDSSTTAQQQNVPAGQGFAEAFMTPANDVFTSDVVSTSLPALTDDPQDETSNDDIESDDDDGIEVNEDGTEATRFASVRKRTEHAPMTEEQQRMTLLQLSAQRTLFDANPASRNFKNAPAHLQQPPASTSISPTKQVSSSSKTIPQQQSALPQKGPKRGRPSAKEKELPPRKKQKKAKIALSSDTLNALASLNNLGKPFEKMVEGVVSYATGVLDQSIEDCTEQIEELVRLEAEWKASHAEMRGKVVGVLEKYGLIPLGGVEAAAGGLVKSA